MSAPRWLPPVHSPLSAAALLRGFAAAFGILDAAALRALARRLDDSVILTGSGTEALQLAIGAAARGRGVALPAYGCFDLATAAVGAGVPVYLYDLDPATLGPDWPSLAAAVRETGAVVVAHPYGVPVDVRRVRELALAHDSLVIEDAAQGAGVLVDGCDAGRSGTFGILSFGRGKGRTGGGGGALLLNDQAALDATAGMESALGPASSPMRGMVAASAQWCWSRPGWFAIPSALPWLRLGETIYRNPTPPRWMPDAFAAVADALWLQGERESIARRTNAERLLATLPLLATLVPRGPAQATPGWLRLPLVLTKAMSSALLEPADLRLGIRPAYPATLDQLPALRPLLAEPGAAYPGASLLVERLRTVPVHGQLAHSDLEALQARLASVVQGIQAQRPQ